MSAALSARISVHVDILDFNENLSRNSKFRENRAKYQALHAKTEILVTIAGDLNSP